MIRKRIVLLLAFLLVLALLPAAAQNPALKVLKTYQIGGEGGWDALTLDAPNHRLFIARENHAQIVDTETGKLVGELADTPGIHAVAIVRPLNRLVTSNGKADTATVFDAQTLKPLGTVKTGQKPDLLIYDPASKRVFIFNGKSNNATVLDPEKIEVVGTIAFTGNPEFATTDGKGTVFVNLESAGAIAAIDTQKLTVKSVWPLPGCEEPTGIALDRKNKRLFSVCHNSKMMVVDSVSGKVIATLPIGAHPDGAEFDPQTQLAYSSNADGTLTVVKEESPEQFRVVQTVTTMPGAKTMALDTRAHLAYLVAQKYGEAAVATATNPRPRRQAIPGSFSVLVVGAEAAAGAKPAAEKRDEWGKPPAAEFAPQRVMLGWLGDPAHTQAITWRTEKLAETPQVQFALGSANPDFISNATAVPAKSSALSIGTDKTVSSYRANLQGLKPATRYLYRVGDGRNWGEWNGFQTASEQPARFRFIWVGDAQNDIRSRWSRVIQAAYARAPRSAFIFSAGDLVATGYKDDLWGEWYDSMGFIAANVPNLAVPGNHELEVPRGQPRTMSLPAIWKQQFSYPQNGPDIAENESYYLDYQGVRIISLNVNMLETDQPGDDLGPMPVKLAAWLESVLKNNPNQWTFVFQHQGIFSMAHERNYVKMRELLTPLYDKYGVDLVMQGHDHLYARSQKLAGGKIVAADAPGTVYLISVSGPKMYEVDKHFEPLMAKVVPNTQMYQVVDVNGDRVTMCAFSSEGQQVDAFQLEKKKGAASVYSELKPPAAPAAAAAAGK